MMEPSADGVAIMQRAIELSQAGEPFVMATVVWRQAPSSGHHGSRAIVTADGTLYGWVGGACAEPVLIREARKVLAGGTPTLLWLGQEGDLAQLHVPEGVVTVPISCQSEGALQIFIEPVLASPHVVIVGRSPMAWTLLELVKDLDWRGELVDGPEFTASMVKPSSIVVVATQGHGDEEVLETAVRAEPAFIGLVASRKRGEAVRGYLADKGLPAEALDRVQAPMGLDLGHTSHREMAVSILAELVQLRSSGAFNVAAGTVEGTQIREVIDLVCHMTVEAIPANRPFEYEGTTYYFCAPGCRKAFEKDPTSFINQEIPC